MVEPGSLIVVHFIEQQLEGWTFQRAHWPLHITLIPWFKAEDEEAVDRALRRVAGDIEPLRLEIGGIEEFGVHHEVPVNVIASQKPVKALHELLFDVLDEADIAFHEQRFMGEQFVAHVTRHEKDKRFANKGERIILHDFHLVRLTDKRTCRVETQFLLKHVY